MLFFCLILCLTGLFIGILSAFLGIGGGVLAIPAMYALFPKLSPQTAVGTSLCMIFFNSCINLYQFKKQGFTPRLQVVLTLCLCVMLGSLSGASFAHTIEPIMLKRFFGATVLFTLFRILFFPNQKQMRGEWSLPPTFANYLKLGVTGFSGGLIASLTGLGGGAIMVPLFIGLLHISYTQVSSYSNLAMCAGTLSGLSFYALKKTSEVSFPVQYLNFFQSGHVNFALALILSFGAFLSSPYGVKLANNANAKTKRKFYVVLLSFVAVKTLFF